MGNAVNSDPKSASEGQSQPFDDSNSEDGSRDEESLSRRIKKHESFRLQRTPIAPRVTPSPARVDVAATTDGKDGSQPAGEDRAAGREEEAEELASESSDDDSVGPVEVALRGTAQYTSFILTRKEIADLEYKWQSCMLYNTFYLSFTGPGNNGACIGKVSVSY